MRALARAMRSRPILLNLSRARPNRRGFTAQGGGGSPECRSCPSLSIPFRNQRITLWMFDAIYV